MLKTLREIGAIQAGPATVEEWAIVAGIFVAYCLIWEPQS